MNTRRIILSVGVVFILGTAPAFGTVIADSVAEFSGVQGQANWNYGYWDRTHDGNGQYSATEFQQMTQYVTGSSINYGNEHAPLWFVQDGSYWTGLWVDGGAPNGTNGNSGRLPIEHWSMRRWTSEVSGQIEITGQVGWAAGWSGSGIIGRIFVDGAQVFSHTVEGGNQRFDYSIIVQVNAQSKVDFTIDPNGVDVSDHGYFTASISPEPTSALLVVIGITGMSLRRRGR